MVVRSLTNTKIMYHIIFLIISLLISIPLMTINEDASEQIIKTSYNFISGKNLDVIIEYDGSGIPITDYAYFDGRYIGKQINPDTVSQKAAEYYTKYAAGDVSYKQRFLNCSDWIVNNSKSYGNYSLLEYEFSLPTYNMTNPWRSGMAQGEALRVMGLAYKITNDTKYRDTGKQLLHSFYIQEDNGGITAKSMNHGWWYEEYADDGGKQPRILNGMMFAILGVYDYYDITHDPKAKFIFDQGILSLKNDLPQYDMNGYSYYDIYKNPARKKYHEIHIQLLGRLYNITHENEFNDYQIKWKNHSQPYFINRLISKPTQTGLAIFAINVFFVFFVIELLYFISRRVRNRH